MLQEKDEQDYSEVATSTSNYSTKWRQRLATWGVELRGIQPVPIDERTDTNYQKICYILTSSNLNILTFSLGTIGPVSFGLGVRDTCLVIVAFQLLFALPPAYFCAFGSRLGMRQMVLSRYTFGYYGVILPAFLNLITTIGFAVSSCILGGQALASVTNGHLSWTVGITIFAIFSLLVSFCGIRVFHWFERILWIPSLIAFIIVIGVGGKHFHDLPVSPPPTVASILGYAGTQAGFMITWSGYTADYNIYMKPAKNSSWKIFLWGFIGLILSTVPIACVGAVFAVAATSVPAWNSAYAGGNIGGLLEAALQPLGGFGKLLTVLLSLSVSANVISVLYSSSFNFQVFIPKLVVVPRYILTVVTVGIVLPVSIVGAHRFYVAITNFLALIGYWSAAYVSIVFVEHLYFRSGKFSNYDLDAWDKVRELPLGIAAVLSFAMSFALVIPCISQVWFTGPIAKTTGDLGLEIAFVVNIVLYPPLRMLEKRFSGR